MRRVLSVFLNAFILILLISPFALAQGSKMRVSADPDTQETQEQDNPAARDAWFRRGRISPDGRPVASWLNQAFSQKLKMRANFMTRLHAMATQVNGASLTPSATIPVAGGSAVWSPMGPGPMNDDNLTGQNYGPNVGRITAVAVNPADTTGNTVIVGAAYGGTWISYNAAANDPTTVYWQPLLDQQATLAIGSVSWKPDGSVILIGSGEGNSAIDSYYGLGVFRSTDAGNTWNQITSSADGHSFLGLGMQRQAWSKTSPNVAAIATTFASRTEGANASNSLQGLYYSTDSGTTWKLAQFYDAGTLISVAASSNSVVWSPVNHKFYAHLRYHGIYVSRNADDPSIFDRLVAQPDAASPTVNSLNTPGDCSPTAANDTTCPIQRAEIAVHPTRNEIYIWWISLTSTGSPVNKGIWKSLDGGQSWVQLTDTGFTSCGDSSGCGATQAFYNMSILSVSNPTTPTQTDLYIGSVNLYKCTVDNTVTGANAICGNSTADSPFTFKNLTHVYGCTPDYGSIAHVHPDQHDLSAALGTNILYFGHDGGISRTLDSTTINTGLCTGTNGFQNVNFNMGALTQFVWGTAIPGDANGAIGGSQDNASAAVFSGLTPTNGQTWVQINGGDGGYNDIDSSNTNTWYTANTYVSVQKSTAGTSTNRNSWTDIVTSSNVGTDHSAFYMPYMLDPQLTSQILLGTCRIWRGPNTPWSSTPGTAISPMLTSTGTCTTSDSNVSAIATGSSTATAGYSKVIWTALDNGAVWMTSDSSATTPAWTNVTPPYTLNPGPNWGNVAPGFPVTSIAVDQKVAAGSTAYISIQGFHVAHVLKTTNGGASWTDISNGLPDAPANSIAIDPDDSNVLYVGTDVGVFSLDQSTASPSWLEVGPLANSGSAGYIPNVPVYRVIRQDVGATPRRLLKAVTYGRGVWLADIGPSGTASLSVTPGTNPTIDFGTVAAPLTSTQTVTLTNTGTAALTISNSILSDTTNYQVNGISCGDIPVSIAQGGSCRLAVTFRPQANGTLTATLTLTDNAGGHVLNFAGVGSGISTGTLTPSPASLTFNNTALNTASAARSLTLTNSGSTAISITGITFTGTNSNDFSQTNSCNNTVAASGTCVLNVAFKPTETGTRTATISIANNGTVTPATASLSGIGEDFSQTLSSSTATVAAGSSATFTVTETPSSGSFGSNITFSCTGLDSTMSCVFSPTQVTPGSAATTTSLTITTIRSSSTAPGTQQSSTGGRSSLLFAFWLALPAMMTVLVPRSSRSKLSWKMKVGLLLPVIIVMLSMASCGGGGSGGGGTIGTRPGAYSIGVVATSGSLSHTSIISLTVQ
jgi:hypothetical protein